MAKEQKAPEGGISDEKDLQIYEVGYLLLGSLSEQEVAEKVGEIKKIILDDMGGVEVSSEMPRLMELAYTFERTSSGSKGVFTNGYFGWVKFEIYPDKILKLTKALESNPKILRFLVTKTVRENTMSSKKPVSRPADRKKSDEPQMSEEELDKTIKELVIE